MNIGHIFSKQLKQDINGNAILKVFLKVFNEQVGFPHSSHGTGTGLEPAVNARLECWHSDSV